MSLRERQSLFAVLLAELIAWISKQGWAVTLADGSVDTPRKFRAEDGRVFWATDAHHMPGSLHYQRLAQDLNLFVDGAWISRASPVWAAIGEKWLSLHPDCSWGGDWDEDHRPFEPGEGDANHFSIAFGGKK